MLLCHKLERIYFWTSWITLWCFSRPVATDHFLRSYLTTISPTHPPNTSKACNFIAAHQDKFHQTPARPQEKTGCQTEKYSCKTKAVPKVLHQIHKSQVPLNWAHFCQSFWSSEKPDLYCYHSLTLQEDAHTNTMKQILKYISKHSFYWPSSRTDIQKKFNRDIQKEKQNEKETSVKMFKALQFNF